MSFIKHLARASAVALLLAGGPLTAKPAQADGGAVIAGVVGGLLLGGLLGSAAHAHGPYYHYQPHPAPRYFRPPPPRYYYAPPPVYYHAPPPSYNYRYYQPPRGWHRGHGFYNGGGYYYQGY